MTVETPPALQIEPRTDAGSGLALPLAKGLSHLWLVYEASAREWPLTVEQAVGNGSEDPEARALLEGVLKITGGELVDAPEVR